MLQGYVEASNPRQIPKTMAAGQSALYTVPCKLSDPLPVEVAKLEEVLDVGPSSDQSPFKARRVAEPRET